MTRQAASLFVAILALSPTLVAPAIAIADTHAHEREHNHGFEIGFGPGLAYLSSEKEFVAGLHVHALAVLGGPWSLGLGYEKLFDDHTHNTFNVVGQYRLAERWSASFAPGITFEGDEILPSAHLETAYEFMLGPVHAGPSLEVAVDPDEVHITLGLHIGFGL